ncbi:MAG: hypothetical protein JWQ66_3735 [Mucilaginibacter sp.]|nr:hypothetical protein [Mucilaginibacter sp.]
MMSSILLENSGNKIDSIANIMGPALTGAGYEIIDEYYTKNTTTKVPNTVMGLNGNNKDYLLTYLALNEEMYVSVLKTTKSISNTLLIAIYGKYGNDWKLNIMQFGQYNVLNKTAPDYYTNALKLYKAGDVLDAADMMLIASQIANPGGLYFKYKNEEEMKTFYSKVVKEANTVYKFPITVAEIKTKPIILGVNPQVITETGREGIYPAINYKSEITLTDTAALRVENDALQKAIGGIFKMIDKNNNHILYQAFNQLPDGKTQLHTYRFVQKIK